MKADNKYKKVAKHFEQNPNSLVTKRDIGLILLGDGYNFVSLKSSDNYARVAMVAVREMLGKNKFETLRGTGYVYKP